MSAVPDAPSDAVPAPSGGPVTAGVARSAGLVGIATMASRILGLLRDQVFLVTFGAGHAMDAYNVAFRLPNLVRDLFAEHGLDLNAFRTVHGIGYIFDPRGVSKEGR